VYNNDAIRVELGYNTKAPIFKPLDNVSGNLFYAYKNMFVIT